MKLKLACADFTFPLLPHDKVLDLIAMLEFQGVDVGVFEGRSHLWPSREFRNVLKSARQLRRKMSDRGLQVADVFLQTNPSFVPFAINHPEARRRRKARDLFLKTLDYANGCGCHHVTTLPGVHFEQESRAASFQRSCGELAWRRAEAEKAGIIFGTEAHVGSIAPTPAEARRLVESVPGLTLTLDYTHFTRAGAPDSAVEPLVQYASHFHVRGARKGRLQASFKENTINYRRIFKAMQRTGYQGYIGIEYVWIDWEHCNESDNLSETVLYRDFFRSLSSGSG